MTKAENTRHLIIEKTAPLFNQKGFDGTSLADLTEATGLSKGALYGHFRDKDEIALEAFQFAVTKVKELVKKELSPAMTCKNQLLALLNFYARYVSKPPMPGGCPLLNMAIEADDHRVVMRRVVVKELLNTVHFIRDIIQRGVDEKEFRKDVEPTDIAYTFFCAIEGALMFSRVERSPAAMNIIVNHCKRIVDQISS